MSNFEFESKFQPKSNHRMKALKIVLLVLLGLVAIFVIYLSTISGDYKVTRSIEIEAPTEWVGSYINNLEKWERWSYWNLVDSTNVITYGDIREGAGANYRWVGNETGEGTIELLSVEPGVKTAAMISFLKPFSSQMNSDFLFSEENGVTTISWENYGSMPFFMRWMAGGMDAAFGNQLDSGLIKLKSIAESELQPTGGKVLSISQEEVSGFSYFYMPYSIQISEMSPDIYSNSYQGIYAYLAEDANTVVGSPACFYESWDMESGTTSFRVALASTSSKEGNDAVLKDTFEGGKAIKAIYQGDYEGSGLAHNAIEEYLNSNGLEMNGAAIELYVTGPADEPNASKWITEIIYPIK